MQQKDNTIYSVSYQPLWHTLIDRRIGKSQLGRLIGASSATITKMSRGEHVALEVIERICAELDCDVKDVITINKVEIIPAKDPQN